MGVLDNDDRHIYEANRRLEFVEWINNLLELDLPLDISEPYLCEIFLDGTVLRGILKKLHIDVTEECLDDYGFRRNMENVERCILSIDEAGFPIFDASDLERGSTFSMIDCLLCLRDNGNQYDHILNGKKSPNRSNCSESDIEHVSRDHADDLFCKVFQQKQGDSSSFEKISELKKSNNFDYASTQSIISAVDKILCECIEKKNGEIPDRIAHSLRKAVQEIERKFSTQVLHVGHLNNVIRTRETKYQFRIKVLETINTGANNEIQIIKDFLERIKYEKLKIENMKKEKEQDILKLIEEKENCGITIAELQKEIQLINESYEKKNHELEIKSQEAKLEMEDKLKNAKFLLSESQKKIKCLEAKSELQDHRWNKKEYGYQNFIGLMMQSLKDLRVVSDSIRNETTTTYKIWENECAVLGKKLKEITDASENYHTVLSENRKLYNEVQELKGNIRVYCRIRPFLPGQIGNATTVDYIGENGEIVITNPLKQGKDGHRMFKFNKVFSPTISQEDVYLDTQPLIRSVLDGFNVCIFAYGQTGSGKTYTMSGPSVSSSKEDWGVNYRALNDLFHLKRKRRSTFLYEVGVQMIEIYNEQVRDLLSNESTPKRLGIWSFSQPNGLTVPDASMHPVKSTSDVFDLMKIGETNRAIGTTALNERSSRSHSILTVHVRGMDLETGSTLRGCLHLVDLAGSERIYRSEAIGDRLKEAQHINKSLSALGDVIYALAQKSAHVPYRNSKLTQVLQSSLGGNAKTFMFVQVNPDIESYSETISTLKFAERVSGVELGAAQSNKEGNDVRGLMEQVMSLKDSVARKDEEIMRLQLLKDLRTQPCKLVNKSLATKPRRQSMSPSGRLNLTAQRGRKLLGRTSSSHYDEFFLQSNLARGDNADVESLEFGDGDSEEKLSDMSYSHSLVSETDVSIMNCVDENKLIPKPLEDPNDKILTKVSSRMPRPSLNKFEQKSLFRSKSKDTSSSRKASAAQVSSTSLSRPSRKSLV